MVARCEVGGVKDALGLFNLARRVDVKTLKTDLKELAKAAKGMLTSGGALDTGIPGSIQMTGGQSGSQAGSSRAAPVPKTAAARKAIDFPQYELRSGGVTVQFNNDKDLLPIVCMDTFVAGSRRTRRLQMFPKPHLKRSTPTMPRRSAKRISDSKSIEGRPTSQTRNGRSTRSRIVGTR